MTALYPVSVRQAVPKVDTVDWILAAHVNELDEEVTSLERVLGVMPHRYQTQTYPDVRSRMDAIQDQLGTLAAQIADLAARLAALEDLPRRMDAAESDIAWLKLQVSQLWDAIRALQNLPRTNMANSGQTIYPHSTNWVPLYWNANIYDSAGIFNGGSRLWSPRTGWWMVVATGIFSTASGTSGDQRTNFEVRINGYAVSWTSDVRRLGAGPSLRMSAVWAGPWNSGSYLEVVVNTNNSVNQAINFAGAISLLYLGNLA